jgi:CheY-like chemotaxis protein
MPAIAMPKRVTLEPFRFLVVDDEYLAATKLHETLCRAGAKTCEFECKYNVALKKALELAPDIISLDVRLHDGLDGFGLFREIEKELLKLGCVPPLPVFITNFNDFDIKKRVFEIPGARILGKMSSENGQNIDQTFVNVILAAVKDLPVWRGRYPWPQALEIERRTLIDRKLESSLSVTEQDRLIELQRQHVEWLDYHAPLDTSHLDILIHELEVKQMVPNEKSEVKFASQRLI